MKTVPKYQKPQKKLHIKFTYMFFAVICLLIFASSYSQTITFQKTMVQPGIQYLRSVIQTPDNGYITVGRTRENSNEYMYILRYDAYGDTIWTKKINIGETVSMIKTNDNHFAACGIYGNIIKFDISGQILFSNNIFNGSVRTKTIIQTSDDSYFLCGDKSTGGDLYPYLAKYDNNGTLLWDSIYTNGFFTGVFSAMTLSEDNNIVLTGHYKQQSNLPNYFFLMKVDQQGNRFWFESVNNYFYASPRSIAILNNGEYVIGGAYNDNDAFLAKFAQNGSFQWLKGYDTTFISFCYSITPTLDGGIVYVGHIDTNDHFLVRVYKTDNNGVEVWRKVYGFKAANHNGWHISQTSDSGFAIVGLTINSQEDIYFLKLDKNGNLLPPIGIQQVESYVPREFKLYQNYPNPFNPTTKIIFDVYKNKLYDTNIKLTILNILGEEVLILINRKLTTGRYEVTMNAPTLASGTYFYALESDSYYEVKKMIILK